jgi:DeoR/GlpR family transcriptional regulator of sugar metabolism/ABC-type sugar transport system substrate-binding protein
MIPGQREVAILSALQQRGVVTVSEICAMCQCSPVTARRDLERLEQQGLLLRTHGGAMLPNPAHQTSPSAHWHIAQETRTALLDHCDVLVATPAETLATRLLLQRALRSGIPIVAESTICEGATTAVSIDDYHAGVELGRWVGTHAPKMVGDDIKVLYIGAKLPNCAARGRGFAEGLHITLPGGYTLLQVDGEGLWHRAYQIAADAFMVHPGINVICGVNDDSALAALEAYRAAGRDERQLLVVSFGLEGDRARDALSSGGPFRASIAMFPEVVGRACVDAAICAYHRCALPRHIVTPHALVTCESLEQYYHRREDQNGVWSINWPVVTRLSSVSTAYSLLGRCHDRPKPRRVGLVVIFSEHDWYRNIQRTMRVYAHSLGIHLQSVDASQDAAQEIDMLKRSIGCVAAQLVNSGDTIILDSGRTTAYLAQYLHGRQNITVITNSVPVLAELGNEPGITVVATGGTLRRESMALSGPAAEAALYDLRADKAFITGTGVSLEFGLSNTNIQEATVKLMMAKAAREVILLADHTKLGVESLVKVAPLQMIHRLVTDAGISPQLRWAFIERGIEVTTADELILNDEAVRLRHVDRARHELVRRSNSCDPVRH